MNKNLLRKILLSLVMVLATALTAEEAAVPGPLAMPAWIKLPLDQGSYFANLYSGALAQSLYLRNQQTGFLPPIQALNRHSSGNLEKDASKIVTEVLRNLEVDVRSKLTIDLKKGNFKAGEKHNLEGWYREYQSADKYQNTLITCLAIVKDGTTTHAIYTEGLQSSLPSCVGALVELSRTPYLYQ